MGKQTEAIQYLNKALQIDETNVEALTARGALYDCWIIKYMLKNLSATCIVKLALRTQPETIFDKNESEIDFVIIVGIKIIIKMYEVYILILLFNNKCSDRLGS